MSCKSRFHNQQRFKKKESQQSSYIWIFKQKLKHFLCFHYQLKGFHFAGVKLIYQSVHYCYESIQEPVVLYLKELKVFETCVFKVKLKANISFKIFSKNFADAAAS